jgi:chromosome segregation ATPase
MNRWLHILNLAGVVALTLICVFQWRRDRALNLELNRSEKLRLEQTEKLAEQEKTLRGATDDLGIFKEQFARAQVEAANTGKELRALQQTNSFLSAAYEYSQENLTVWSNAVATRDKLIADANENIKTMNERAQDLGTRLNESIRKFNELATNYNTVVETLNSLRKTNGVATAKP